MTSHFGGSGGELIGGGQVRVALADPACSTTVADESRGIAGIFVPTNEKSLTTLPSRQLNAVSITGDFRRRAVTTPNFPSASAVGNFGHNGDVTTRSPGPAPPVISKWVRRATVF